ncbi:unnamed protein product [Orchesella dallaii]|uniref:BTB domain-containing protein n=1 Tax=Orchesella dallaii TaxID=48710 RepID=A0ABP1Q180_9HEXA
MDQQEPEDFSGCATSTTEKTSISSSRRAIWTLKSINCDADIEALIASGVKCFVDLDESIRLRFYFNKFEVSTGGNDKEVYRYLSLWVDVVPREGDGNQVQTVVPEVEEGLSFTVKVNRLTRSLDFDYVHLFETGVTIKSQEDRNGVLVENYFFNYYNEKMNSGEFQLSSEDTMSFELVVTRVHPKTSHCAEEASGPVSYGEALSSLFCNWDLVNPSGSKNQFEMKLVAKDHVKLDAKNFLLAARDHALLRKKEEDTDSKSSYHSDDSAEITRDCWFDQEKFLRAILEWIYLGELSESSGELVQEIVDGICSIDQVNDMTQLLVEEASRMTYGFAIIDPFDSEKMELRAKVGKKLTMERINEFVQEFGDIVATMLDYD